MQERNIEEEQAEKEEKKVRERMKQEEKKQQKAKNQIMDIIEEEKKEGFNVLNNSNINDVIDKENDGGLRRIDQNYKDLMKEPEKKKENIKR